MKKWKFDMGAALAVDASGETGLVIGRAEFDNAENSYLLRYKAGDGRAVESWWGESALRLD